MHLYVHFVVTIRWLHATIGALATCLRLYADIVEVAYKSTLVKLLLLPQKNTQIKLESFDVYFYYSKSKNSREMN